MWKREGKRREMGLGSLSAVPLAKARERATECRALVAAGRDPIEDAKASKADRRFVPTFGELADRYIETKSAEWRSAKHVGQWRMTLRDYAAPLRSKPVDAIGTEDVLAVLQPLWLSKPETASRLRGRIEHVLDAARASGHRIGENPARWRGHLDKLLPKRPKLSRGHHAAMAFEHVPPFLAQLRQRDSVAALALEFAILTAARSGEVLGAKWSEIDLETKIWTVPATRMKAGRAHRVPLSSRAISVLKYLEAARDGDFVFPGGAVGRPLSVMALEMVLRRMNVDDATVHGFRSAFRDWAGEETHFPREVAEAALAHVIGDKAEQAYRRGDALEKRRSMMEAWAEFLQGGKAQNIVDFRAAGRHSKSKLRMQ